jgi:16S rRNA G966 N2-methylase RsmD
VVKLIAHEELLRESGILIAEHSVREAVEDGCDPLVLRDQRRYGSTLVSFFGQKMNKT